MEADVHIILGICLFAGTIIAIFYLPSIKTTLNLGDEGYLWHGTLEVMNGKVPIRDFRAYDPGRYYYSAIWLGLFGSTLLSLRIGMFVAKFITLSIVMIAVYSVTQQWESIIMIGFLMMPWLFPLHKQLDILLSASTALVALLLVNSPTEMQYFISGGYIAICFLFGLNHAIYAGIALTILALLLSVHNDLAIILVNIRAYAIGLSVGCLPIALLHLIVPGLFKSYWQQKVKRILKRKTANLPLSVPWLWQSNTPQLAAFNRNGQTLIKLLFTAMPVIYIAIILSTILKSPAEHTHAWSMLAIACCGLLYLHHAYSRADLSHLSQSLAPLLMCLVILCSTSFLGKILITLLSLLFFQYIYRHHAIWLKRCLGEISLEKFTINNINFWLPSGQKKYLENVKNLIEIYSQNNEYILALPTLVSLYPLFNRKPPVYDIFCVYPATPQEDKTMLQQLLNQPVQLALINNSALDSREELRFCHTHPIVWQYLNTAFTLIDHPEIPKNHYAFIRIS